LKQELIRRLMELPNATWVEIMVKAQANIDFLWAQGTVEAMDQVLKTNTAVCSAIKSSFGVQLARIFVDILQIYQLYSEALTAKIAEIGSEAASKSATIQRLRTVKREILKLITTFVDTAQSRDHPNLLNNYYPRLSSTILPDYANAAPAARDPEALDLFTAFLLQIKGGMVSRMPDVFETLFFTTYEMLVNSGQEWPDHYVPFFKFVEAVNKHCFPALLALGEQQFDYIFDSIVLSIRNLQQNIQEIGLSTLNDLISNFLASEFANQFAKTYYQNILALVLDVLTDTFHPGALPSLANILNLMIRSLMVNQITMPIWDESSQQFESNLDFFAQCINGMILEHFDTVSDAQVKRFVNRLIQSTNNITNFRQVLRDFLIELREYSSESPQALIAALEASRGQEGPVDLEEQERLELKKEQDARYKASVPGLTYIAPKIERTEAGLVDEDNEDVIANTDFAEALGDD